jgi:tRNA pseudouridine38-40 synthase
MNPEKLEHNQNPDENLATSPSGASESARTPYRQCAADHVRVRLHLEYDGTDFSGWQRQTTRSSVQGSLEAAISKICGKPIHVLGASRTDAGVHALRQVAHFDCPRDPEAFDFRYAIQCLIPESIVVREFFLAPRDFHAIALVSDKIYKYRILNRRVPSALQKRYTHWVRFPLDTDFLNAASAHIVGKQDFKALQSSGTPVQTTVRYVREASWARVDDDILEFTIRGDGFLKQMVRNIVGTLVDLNQRNEPPERMKLILDTLDRKQAGPTAPPQGLFLYQVNYPEEVDNGCRRI